MSVSDAIHVGSVLGKSEGIDPTTVGSGAESAILLFGFIARLLTSMFFVYSSNGHSGHSHIAEMDRPYGTKLLPFFILF
jgi:hypothetical protein